MLGAIITLLKNPMTDCEKYNNINEYEKDTIVTTWMHYDYLNIREIDTFSDFYEKNFVFTNKKDLIQTDIQAIYLYNLNYLYETDSSISICKPNNNSEGFVKYLEKSYRFVCVTTFKISRDVLDVLLKNEKEKYDFNQKLCFVKEKLEAEIKNLDMPKPFKFEIFGTLGQEEIVMISTEDMLSPFYNIIQYLRNGNLKNLIISTYSFVFSNFKNIDCKNKIYQTDNNEETDSYITLDMDASLSFTLKPCGSAEFLDNLTKYLKAKSFNKTYDNVNPTNLESLDSEEPLKEKNYYTFLKENNRIKYILGKYDLQIFIEKGTWNFLEEFNEGGLFNNELFYKGVYQLKTNWLLSSEINLSQNNEISYEEKNCIKKQTENINKKFDEINKKFKELKKENKALSNTLMYSLEYLIVDYKKNVLSAFSDGWNDILHEQLKIFIDNLETMAKDSPNEIDMKIFEIAINSIRQTYVHINQACRMFFEVPAMNLRYTGSYNKILKSYYGIVNTLNNIANCNNKIIESKSSNIVPIINFEYTSRIRTEMFSVTETIADERLVVYHLPYDCILDIPKFIPYLCHEIYHFISPADRMFRNNLVARLWCANLFGLIIRYKLVDILSEKLENISQNYIIEFTDQLLKNQFDQLLNFSDKFLVGLRYYKVNSNEETIDYETLIQDYSFDKFFDILIYNFIYIKDFNSSELFLYITSILPNIIDEIKKNKDDYLKDIINEKNSFILKDAEIYFEGIKKIEPYDISNNTVNYQDAINKFYREYAKTTADLYLHSLKEACCDFFAVKCMDMNFKEYIIFLFSFFENKAEYQDMLKKSKSISDGCGTIENGFYLRIGLVFDAIFCKSEKRENKTASDWVIENLNTIKEEKPNGAKMKNLIEFCDLLYENYKQYLNTFSHLSKFLLQTLFMVDFPNISKDINLQSALLLMRESYKKYYQRECLKFNNPEFEEDNKKKIEYFKCNLSLMNYFQDELILTNSENNEDKKETNNKTSRWKELIYINSKNIKSNNFARVMVSSLSEYISEVKRLSNFLIDNNENVPEIMNTLWYRGEHSFKHHLIPGLLREKSLIKNKKLSPLEYQLNLIDMFLSMATSAAEINGEHIEQFFDWMVIMQHYGLKTNLLDWSENAFIALYFAIENADSYNENKNGKSNDKKDERIPAVYILNPAKMNCARKKMMKKDFYMESELIYPVPNFSNSVHIDEYSDFYPYDPNIETDKKIRKWQNSATDDINSQWPVAIHSSLSNIRIRSQFGAFTVSNLLSHRKKSENNKCDEENFNYLDIKNMQKEFLSRFPTEKKFLHQILINPDMMESIVQDLYRTGIKRLYIYPQLNRMSELINSMYKYRDISKS